MHSESPRGVPSPKHSQSGRANARRSTASATLGRREIQLSPLELALIAEFNREMAAAYDQVANDPTAQSATRQVAQESAARRRERAELFQLEARRASTYPAAVAHMATQEERPNVGPERRRRERRSGERRRLRFPPQEPLSHAERRTHHDRRQHERRGSDCIVTEQQPPDARP